MKQRRLAVLVLLAALLFSAAASGEEILTWDECEARAARNHPDLKSAREKMVQARADEGIARSRYLPQLSATLSMSRTRTIIPERESYNVSTMSRDLLTGLYLSQKARDVSTPNYTYGVSGKQLLFDGFKTYFDIRSAERTARGTEFQYRAVSASIRYSLRAAFVKLLRAQDAVEIMKEIVKRRKKNLELVQMRYRAGREHKGSLMNADANLAQAKYEFQQAERNVFSAQRGLLKEMGLSGQESVRVTGTLDIRDADRRRPDFTALAESHPSVRAMMLQKEAADYGEKSKAAAFSPSVNLTGSATKSDSVWPPRQTNLSVGIEFLYPFFEGGKTYYEYSKSGSATRQATADLKSTREKALLSLEQKWIDWQNAMDLVTVQRKFVRASEERAKIAEGQYSIGLILFDNWSIIEDDLVRAKKALLEAQASALIAEADWLQARGETVRYAQ